jgi:hypothetical protein
MDRAVDSVDLGNGKFLYTAMSEERILARNPDIRDCTVVAFPSEGGVHSDVLLLLAADADPERDRREAVRASLDPDVAATLRSVVVVSDDDLVTGPTGKVRKFLMRQRHLAAMA